MTSSTVETIGIESTARAGRALQHARQRSVDDLGGRTVWCVAALPGGRRRADALQAALGRAGEAGVRAEPLAVAAHERLQQLAERLAAVLATPGRASAPLGREERQLYEDAVDASESWLERRVRPGDVVVLHDPLVAVLASAAREHGAHAVWHVDTDGGEWPSAAGEALAFLRRYASPLDAYVLASFESAGRQHVVERIAAFMPAAGLVAEHDVTLRRWPRPAPSAEPAPRRDLGWTSVLAQVIERDRQESVGGRLHPRPAVAGR